MVSTWKIYIKSLLYDFWSISTDVETKLREKTGALCSLEAQQKLQEIPQGEVCRLRLFQSPHPSRLPPGHCQSPSVVIKVRKFSLAGPGWPWKALAKFLEALLYVAVYLRGRIAAYPPGDASGGSPKHRVPVCRAICSAPPQPSVRAVLLLTLASHWYNVVCVHNST